MSLISIFIQYIDKKLNFYFLKNVYNNNKTLIIEPQYLQEIKSVYPKNQFTRKIRLQKLHLNKFI